ncbi:hypothetical protein HK100_012041, partial [Physocladia obscura]
MQKNGFCKQLPVTIRKIYNCKYVRGDANSFYTVFISQVFAGRYLLDGSRHVIGSDSPPEKLNPFTGWIRVPPKEHRSPNEWGKLETHVPQIANQKQNRNDRPGIVADFRERQN